MLQVLSSFYERWSLQPTGTHSKCTFIVKFRYQGIQHDSFLYNTSGMSITSRRVNRYRWLNERKESYYHLAENIISSKNGAKYVAFKKKLSHKVAVSLSQKLSLVCIEESFLLLAPIFCLPLWGFHLVFHTSASPTFPDIGVPAPAWRWPYGS